jgi:hypothetical protein
LVRVRLKSTVFFVPLFCCLAATFSQDSISSSLNESGQVDVGGRPTPYLIRHLPVNSFPQLPPAVENVLLHRGCLIPQTYEAHQPENVIHASLERTGSSDWAVLCSAQGHVSLLVFFASNYSHPMELATAPETERLQSRVSNNVLGFNWGIDTASPEQVRGAQIGLHPLPPRIEHDALADSVIDHRTMYHFYSNNTWTLLDTVE